VTIAILLAVSAICILCIETQYINIGIFTLVAACMLCCLLFSFCRLKVGDNKLVFYYPFNPFGKHHSYYFLEIEEVTLTTRRETPMITITFWDEHRRISMYSDGYCASHSHMFSRKQLLAIAQAMRLQGINAVVE
jgi:hypothetical protein